MHLAGWIVRVMDPLWRGSRVRRRSGFFIIIFFMPAAVHLHRRACSSRVMHHIEACSPEGEGMVGS